MECFDELRGAIRLALEGEGVPHGWSQPLRFLRGPGPFDLGEIHVPRVGSVAGRVLNQMGQPLPKILVRSGIEHAWRGSSLREDITDLEDPRSGLHAWTDEHGRFSLAGLGPGKYRLAGLQAGVYTLQVQYFATSPIEEVAERLQGNPLLENGVDSRLSREIQLEAAVEQRVDLELPPLGRIEGSVLLAGEPVAGAIVLAVPAEQTSAAEAPLMTVRSFDGEKAHHWLAFDKTGADGSYCLYSSKPGSYDLRVRQPGSAGCSEPVLVRLPKADSRVRQDLELPGGTLRAQYLLSSFDAKALRSAKAYLLASDIARANPSYTDFEFGGAIPLTFELTGLEPDALGRVEFRGLRPGAWVLRLMSQFDKTLDVREVVIGAHESVDLGTLEARKRHALDLLCESTKLPKPGAKPKPSDPLNPGASFGVFVYQPSPSQAQGYFVAAVYIAGNRVRPHLAPGRYLCELRSYVTEGMSISFEGEAASKLIPLTVRPDGSTDPAVLRF